jgi:5'-deoxynucleotidase YfbR-like HD superfamily hydrolase
VMVMWMCPNELKPAALLHDAAEAYTGDIIKPLKVLLGTPLLRIENALKRAIAEKFEIDVNDWCEENYRGRLLKKYDKCIQQMEWKYFFTDNDDGAFEAFMQSKNYTGVLRPRHAEAVFRMEYESIFKTKFPL